MSGGGDGANGGERELIARMVVDDLPDGAYVNLGIGLPVILANVPVVGKEVVYHSENGFLGVGPSPPPGVGDPDVINAGKQIVTVVPGASFMGHADSFALIRGGHLDIAVLGAYQVSRHGDLANYSLGAGTATGVGGAMDLALGAKQIWVTMQLGHRAAQRLVEDCSLPLTARGVVRRVYTELGAFDVRDGAFWLRALAPGASTEQLAVVLAPGLLAGVA